MKFTKRLAAIGAIVCLLLLTGWWLNTPHSFEDCLLTYAKPGLNDQLLIHACRAKFPLDQTKPTREASPITDGVAFQSKALAPIVPLILGFVVVGGYSLVRINRKVVITSIVGGLLGSYLLIELFVYTMRIDLPRDIMIAGFFAGALGGLLPHILSKPKTASSLLPDEIVTTETKNSGNDKGTDDKSRKIHQFAGLLGAMLGAVVLRTCIHVPGPNGMQLITERSTSSPRSDDDTPSWMKAPQAPAATSEPSIQNSALSPSPSVMGPSAQTMDALARGGDELKISTPKGFVSVNTNEMTRAAMQRWVPTNMHLIDGFLTEADARRIAAGGKPTASRYIVVEEPAQEKDRYVSEEAFAQARAELNSSLSAITSKATVKANQRLAERMPRAKQNTLSLRVTSDGLVIDRPDCAAYFAVLDVESNSISTEQVNGYLSIQRINGKLVLANAYEDEDDPDPTWLLDSAKNWVDSLGKH